jgi:hypothetical protein
MISLLLTLSAAHALPVAGEAQVAMMPSAFETISRRFVGEEFGFGPMDHTLSWECYDRITIQDINVQIPVESIDLRLRDDGIEFFATFGTIHGEDMPIVASDDDWFDWCPSFETELYDFQVRNMEVGMLLRPSAKNGKLDLQIAEPIWLDGDMSMDLAWIPDDMMLYFFEDMMWQLMADQIFAMGPDMMAEMAEANLYSGSYGMVDYSFDVDGVDVSPTAFEMGVSPEVSFSGGFCAGRQPEEALSWRTPELDLLNHSNSDFAFGMTEQLMNEMMTSAWSDGLLCMDDEDLPAIMAMTGFELPDIPLDSLDFQMSLSTPPSVMMDTDGMWMVMDGIEVDAQVLVNGAWAPLATVRAAVDAHLELGVDTLSTAFTLDVHDLTLTVDEMNIEGMLSDREGAEERFLAFLERWLGTALDTQLQTLSIYPAMLATQGMVVRLDGVQQEAGGMSLGGSIFLETDPEVDLVAPNTRAWVEQTGVLSATVAWDGTDDRSGTLAYQWRLDGGSWSSWTLDSSHTLTGLAAGVHRVEVQARDAWWNVDPEPVSLELSVEADGRVSSPDEKGSWLGCQVAQGSGRSPLALFLGLLALAVRRRGGAA